MQLTRAFFLASCLFFTCLKAAEAETPGEAVQDIVAGLKSGGGYGAILENVDWDFIFSQMPDSARQSLAVNSPDDLRRYNREFYRNPGAAIMRRALEPDSGISPERAGAMAQQTEEHVAKNNHRLAAADYSIGQVQAGGGLAVVAVTISIDGNTTESNFNLRQSGAGWKLSEYPPPITIEAAPPEASGARGPRAAPVR